MAEKKSKIERRKEQLEYGILAAVLFIVNCFGAKYLFDQFVDSLVSIGAMVFINLFILWLFFDWRSCL